MSYLTGKRDTYSQDTDTIIKFIAPDWGKKNQRVNTFTYRVKLKTKGLQLKNLS